MPDETKPNGTPPESPQSADKPAAETKTAATSPAPPASAAENPSSTTAADKNVRPTQVPPAASAAAKPGPPKPVGPMAVPWESEFVSSLKKVYGSGIKEASTYLGQNYVVVEPSILTEILLMMREDEGFDYCVDITAVHYPKREKAEFDVVYVLYSYAQNTRVRVKTQIGDGGTVPSAVSTWPTANWLEREVFDMFGIRFEGHPDMKRILLPDEWKGHPLRKDYDILKQDTEWVKINLGIESAQ
jgi:NADH-quinone oxidoreductase subunit C